MDKQKIFTKLLSIVLVMTMFLTNVKIINNTIIEVEAASEEFAGGDGSEGNPYQISTAEQLNNVRKYLGENTYFKLINHIDLTEFIATNDPINGWTPIGVDYNNSFNGHFDGDGYTITGLWISRSSEDYIGLFGIIKNSATISNLGIKISCEGVRGEYFVGGLVGWNKGEIKNSYATGCVNGYSLVGGLVGDDDGTITNSYATGDISGNQHVGGLAGRSYGEITNGYATGCVNGVANVGGLVGSSNAKITNSYATGCVSDKVEGYYYGYSGGLIGNNRGTITSSYATGYVSGNGNSGGLVGQNEGTITSSYAIGNIEGLGDDYVGGLVGINWNGTITSSYAIGEVNGKYTGGLVGRNNDKMESRYATSIDDANSITNSYFNQDTTKQTQGVGKNEASGIDITSLTTAEMTRSDTLTGSMSGLGSGWSKRNKADDYCYYPELTYFYDDGKLDTKSKNDSEKSVRVERIELGDGAINPTTQAITYGTNLGDIRTSYKYSTTDDLVVTGSICWDEEEDTIPKVSDLTKSYTGTFIPDDDLYYSVKNVSITINVIPKELSITGITVNSKTYDGTTTATVSNQGTLEGLLNNDEVTIESISASFNDTNVGENKDIEIITTIKGNDRTNYTIVVPTDIQADIVPKEPLITPDINQFKYYGETDSTLTYQVEGIIEGDILDFTGALEREAGEEKGNYQIKQGSLSSTNGNYTINFTSEVVFTIKEKATTPAVETGDKKQIISWVTLLSISFIGLIIVKKKQGKQEEVTIKK